MSNPTSYYDSVKHTEVTDAMAERIIAYPDKPIEYSPTDGRYLYFGWVEELGHWVRVVVDNDQLLTRYIDRRLDERFGKP